MKNKSAQFDLHFYQIIGTFIVLSVVLLFFFFGSDPFGRVTARPLFVRNPHTPS